MNALSRAAEYLFLRKSLLDLWWHRSVKQVGGCETYLFRCVQHNYQISFSEKLLTTAGNVALERANPKVGNYLLKHAVEESEHVTWARSDLAIMNRTMGWNRRGDHEVSESIRKLIDRQFQLLEEGNYRDFFGYIVAIEGFHGDAKYWRSFAEEHALPVAAFKSPIRHADLDQEHSIELFRVIDEVFPKERQQNLILKATAANFDLMISCFRNFLAA